MGLTNNIERHEYDDEDDAPEQPFTHIAHAAITAAQAHPDYNGERILVLINDENHGGVVAQGYDNTTLMLDLLANLEAFAKTCGLDLRTIVTDRMIGGQG